MAYVKVNMVFAGSHFVRAPLFIETFATGVCPEYKSVIDTSNKKITYDGKTLDLYFIDTCGLDDYKNMRKGSYHAADVFIILFSLVYPSTLDAIENIYFPEIRQENPKAPYILVGVDSFFRDNFASYAEDYDAPIPTAKGEEMKTKIGAAAYIECDSRKNFHITEAFHAAFDAFLHKQIQTTENKKKKEEKHSFWKDLKNKKDKKKSKKSDENTMKKSDENTMKKPDDTLQKKSDDMLLKKQEPNTTIRKGDTVSSTKSDGNLIKNTDNTPPRKNDDNALIRSIQNDNEKSANSSHLLAERKEKEKIDMKISPPISHEVEAELQDPTVEHDDSNKLNSIVEHKEKEKIDMKISPPISHEIEAELQDPIVEHDDANKSNLIDERKEKEKIDMEISPPISHEVKAELQDPTVENDGTYKLNHFISGEDEKYHMFLNNIGKNQISISMKIVDILNNKVMCKKVLIPEDESFEHLQNAINEFEVLISIDHPSICKVFGINTCEAIKLEEEQEITTVALFLEFLDFDLNECLAKNLLNNTIKARVVVEIVHGMIYIHKNKLVHRDLTMGNIRLNSLMNAKIINFGFAKINESFFPNYTISQSNMVRLKKSIFMSPELVLGEKYNNKTDVYSFGIVLYNLFTGELPKYSLKDKIEQKPISLPEPSSSISEFCVDLISRCTSIDPEDRPSFEDILDEIRANSFGLASNIDIKVVAKRDKELSND